MITLSNGHSFEYMVASGALGFDGKGWLWEKPLVRLRLIRPELFTIVAKTVTPFRRIGNLAWHKPWTWLPISPWSCVRLMRPGSAVNKVGLTNPGVDWWCETVGRNTDRNKMALVGSIAGYPSELPDMAAKLDRYDLVAIEVNPSCPNTGHGFDDTRVIVDALKRTKKETGLPLIIKVSAAQDYVTIARELLGVAEAVSLNSVPFEKVFPPETKVRSPLWRLEKRVGGGSGGISGRLAQQHNWYAIVKLSEEVPEMPVIASSVMKYKDVAIVRDLGARAVSFGAIHLRTPWKPTSIVLRDMKEHRYGKR